MQLRFIETAYASEVKTVTAGGEAYTEVPSQDEGLLASLGINGTLFLSQLLNFALVAGVIWFLILKPVTSKMAERQKLINDSLDNARKIDGRLRQSEKEYQQRIDEAKVEANKIMIQAVAAAERTGDSIKDKAKMEIEQLVDQAKRNIISEREDMRLEIKRSAAELIVAALQKILPTLNAGEVDKKNI